MLYAVPVGRFWKFLGLFAFVSTGLVRAGVNTCKGGNRASVSKPCHIPDFRHKLRAKGIPHTAHSHDNGVFRKLRGQGPHFSFESL